MGRGSGSSTERTSPCLHQFRRLRIRRVRPRGPLGHLATVLDIVIGVARVIDKQALKKAGGAYSSHVVSISPKYSKATWSVSTKPSER